MRTILILAMLISIPSSLEGGQVPAALRGLLQGGSGLRNYTLEFETDINERAILSDETGNIRALDNYLEYKVTGRTAFDRGKLMYHTNAPKILGGKLIDGESSSLDGAYNGDKYVQPIGGKEYSVSAKAPLPAVIMTPFTVFDDNIADLPSTIESIEKGEAKVGETTDGSVQEVNILHANGYRTVWRIDSAKGGAIESISLYYPSGSLCNERKVTQWEEFEPGLWLPTDVVYTGFRENGDRNRRHELKVVKSQVNLPEIDSALFEIEMPVDAIIIDTDMGARINISTDPRIDMVDVPLAVLEVTDRMMAEITAKGEESTPAPSSPEEPDKFSWSSSAGDLKNTGYTKSTLMVVGAVTALILIALALRKKCYRKTSS